MAASDAARSIAGIASVDDDMMNTSLTIIFDDAVTDIEKIKAGMKKEGYPIEGDPEIIK